MSNPLTSPAILTGKQDASNFVMLAIPERPAMMFDHPSSTVLPTGR